jgi:hypothetical protein
MAIIQNQKYGTVVIRDTATNSSITRESRYAEQHRRERD